MKYRHLFFDMDQTIAPSREPILPEMYDLLANTTQDIIIVSGQSADKIGWQSKQLPALYLGQNGNHALDVNGNEMWYTPLSEVERAEILAHIETLLEILPTAPNPEYSPIEDRGAQITFSPIGNTAPVELKRTYDPDRKKREALLSKIPFTSDELVVKIGGSTSFDYIHQNRNKGTNIQKLIDLLGWNSEDCIYFGDGLYPGGNDEAVIGVIKTVPVTDHHDTYNKLQTLLQA